MKNFFKKIPKQYWVIGIISLIQPLYTWGSLAIGGDVMIPFSADVLEKYLFQWQSIQNGLYFSLNYFPLFLYHSLADFLGLSVYQSSFLLLFGINFIGGIGLYKLLFLLHGKKKDFVYSIPILLYLFSPALLNGWHYMYLYAVLPWFFYLLIDIVQKKEVSLVHTLLFTVVIFFSSLDLPNPKYLFYLFVSAAIVFILSFLLGLLRFSFFLQSFWKFILIFFMSLYLFLPLLYFASHYSPEAYSIHTQEGYKDKGLMMDYGTATLGSMYRLHHDGININSEEKGQYLSSKMVIFASYFFILITIGIFLFRKRSLQEDRQGIIFLSLILIFLLFAVGPNPPFGSFYEFLVRNFSLFAFLRTTAGAVFFLALFYAVTTSFFLERWVFLKQKKARISLIFFGVLFIVSHPIFNGDFYKNNSSSSIHINAEERGIKIPEEYFEMKEALDDKLLDTRILIPKMNASYMSANWGYFGPILYNFLYTNNFLSVEKVYTNIYAHGVGYILEDNSLINSENNPEFQSPVESEEIAAAGVLSLVSVPAKDFLPHFFVPERVTFLDELNAAPLQSEANQGEVLFVRDQIKGSVFSALETESRDFSQRPFLEFKKIQPTKYRIRVHQAKSVFPIVFSENFDRGWKVYRGDAYWNKKSTSVNKDLYKTLEGNEQDQAGSEELVTYLDKGLVTSLGDGALKTRVHNTWEGGKKHFDHKEEYQIAFISKNFYGVIQNDNLPKSSLAEYGFSRPLLQEKNHAIVNGYANSWLLDTEDICEKNQGFCRKNADGTYDFEIIIEFWPQKLYQVSLFLSMLFIGLVGVIIFSSRKSLSR